MVHQEHENPSSAVDLGDVTAGDASRITVYTKPQCVQCVFTKQALDRHGIPYTEIDVSVNPTAVARVRAMGYRAVPVIVVSGGTHWQGFSPERIAGLVRRAA